MTDPRPGRDVGITSEPAVIEPLYDKTGLELGEEGGVLGWLQKELGDVLEHINIKEDIDIDSLLGQLFAWTDNKAGAQSIGAVVLPNVVMSILTEFNVKIETDIVDGVEQIDRLQMNGITYDNFGVNYAINPETGKEDANEHRKQFIISALVTAMTDNAKEKLAARLGLKKSALPTIVTMLGLGVDLKTTVLAINFPSISEALFHAENKKNKTDKGFRGLVKSRLANVKDVLSTDLEISQLKNPGKKGKKQTNKPHIYPDLNIETLKEGIRNITFDRTTDYITDGLPSTKEMLKSSTNLTEEQLDRLLLEKTLLEEMFTVIEQTRLIGNVSPLINLQKGLGTGVIAAEDVIDAQDELGLYASQEMWDESKLSVDLRNIFMREGSMHYTYNKMFDEFYHILTPEVLLERTDPFVNMYSKVRGNLTGNPYVLTTEKKGKIRNDMISYLLLKAYDKRLSEDSYTSGLRTSLQNGFIYDHAVFPDVIDSKALNVKDVVDRIKQHLNGKSNMFIDTFVKLQDATHEDNKAGITKLEANTWAQFTDSKLTEIQNSMLELFSDGTTYTDVMHLIHYLAIKDGMQYKQGSFLNVVPTEMTRDMMETIQDVHDLFLDKSNIRDEAYENLFGMTLDEMTDEFVKGYLLSNQNGFYLKGIKYVPESAMVEYEAIEDMGSDPEITIDFTQEEDVSNSKMLSNLAYRPFKYNFKGTEYEFGSVMHAFQVLKQGKFDKNLDKKYRKGSETTTLMNAEGKTIEGKLKKARDAENESVLLGKLVRRSVLQNLQLVGENGATLGMTLKAPKDFIFSKPGSVEAKTTKKALFTARRSLAYSKGIEGQENSLGETRSILNIDRVEKSNVEKENRKASSPVIIEQNEDGENILTVDLYKGLPIKFQDAIKMLRAMGVKFKKGTNIDYKKKNKQNKERVEEIAKELKELGFVINYKKMKDPKTGKKFSVTHLEFPMILKVAGENKGDRPRVFLLKKLMRDQGYTQESDIKSLIQKDSNIAIGNWAQYVEEKQTGTRAVNPISFMWGGVPTTESIIEFGDMKEAGYEGEQNTNEEGEMSDESVLFGGVVVKETTEDTTEDTTEESIFDSEIQTTVRDREEIKEWFEGLNERDIIRFNHNFELKHPDHKDFRGDPWKISYANLQIELENSENSAEQLIEAMKCYL